VSRAQYSSHESAVAVESMTAITKSAVSFRRASGDLYRVVREIRCQYARVSSRRGRHLGANMSSAYSHACVFDAISPVAIVNCMRAVPKTPQATYRSRRAFTAVSPGRLRSLAHWRQ
jgi:hypothetical protein